MLNWRLLDSAAPAQFRPAAARISEKYGNLNLQVILKVLNEHFIRFLFTQRGFKKSQASFASAVPDKDNAAADAAAAEAEAAREARAKVIAAEGEHKASRALRYAAEVISENPAALQV